MATAMVAADANAEQIIARTDQDWLVLTVIDGDTFKTAPPWLISSLQPLSVRIRGIDTPEKGRWADCQSERRLARLAARHTQNKLAKAHRIELRNIDWGKYGGRVVADVWVDGDSLAQSLIKAGLG
ncbi:MAG: thermonuclease family protein, partial [Pseudomonadota bacterium]